MPNYEEEISLERQKIALFLAKLDQCKQRLASLEFLKSNAEDSLDAWASKIIKNEMPDLTEYQAALATTITLEVSNSLQKNYISAGAITISRKKLGKKALTFLSYIGKEGKSLQHLSEFAKKNELGMTNQNIRNFAMVYRKNFQYIESPRVGFYRLTDLGYEVVQKQILELKSETPAVDAEGVFGS